MHCKIELIEKKLRIKLKKPECTNSMAQNVRFLWNIIDRNGS